jgi:uncharacterized protein YqgQ
MDNDEMYFNKYIKYKLKYLNLKKEQEGGGGIFQAIRKIANRTNILPSMPTIPIYSDTRNFDIEQFAVYLDNIQKTPLEKQMYKNIQAKTILTKIKNNYMPYTLDKKIENTINEVFKNNKDKNNVAYINYIKNKKIDFENFQKELKESYDPESLNTEILKNCACHTIIKKDLFFEIKNKLPKFAFIDDAIDDTIAKIKFSEKEDTNLKIIKKELMKQFSNGQYKKFIRKTDEDTTSKTEEDVERDRQPYGNP